MSSFLSGLAIGVSVAVLMFNVYVLPTSKALSTGLQRQAKYSQALQEHVRNKHACDCYLGYHYIMEEK